MTPGSPSDSRGAAPEGTLLPDWADRSTDGGADLRGPLLPPTTPGPTDPTHPSPANPSGGNGTVASPPASPDSAVAATGVAPPDADSFTRQHVPGPDTAATRLDTDAANAPTADAPARGGARRGSTALEDDVVVDGERYPAIPGYEILGELG